jgi:hypothetical protein
MAFDVTFTKCEKDKDVSVCVWNGAGYVQVTRCCEQGMKLQMPCNNVKLFLCTPWKFKGSGGLAPFTLYLSKR